MSPVQVRHGAWLDIRRPPYASQWYGLGQDLSDIDLVDSAQAYYLTLCSKFFWRDFRIFFYLNSAFKWVTRLFFIAFTSIDLLDELILVKRIRVVRDLNPWSTWESRSQALLNEALFIGWHTEKTICIVSNIDQPTEVTRHNLALVAEIAKEFDLCHGTFMNIVDCFEMLKTAVGEKSVLHFVVCLRGHWPLHLVVLQ